MGNLIKNWTDLFFHSFSAFGEKIMGALPNIIGALVVLLIGWLVAKLAAATLRKILQGAKFDNLAKRVKFIEMLEKGNIEKAPSEILSQFIYWIILLLVFITAADILGWKAVSEEISKLIGYLPTLFSAIILFVLGTFIAGFVRDVVKSTTASLGISTGRIISQFIFYLLFIIVSLTALKQGGIDTTIITSNLLIILGSILLAASISYGFASRDIFANILAGAFGKRLFKIGQTIEIDGIRGKIIQIKSIAITIQNDQEKVVIPAHQFVTKKVKIIEPKE